MGHTHASASNLPESLALGTALHVIARGTALVADTVREHICPANVIVTVTPPDFPQWSMTCCIGCLEDADPLEFVARLIPGASVSVRAGA